MKLDTLTLIVFLVIYIVTIFLTIIKLKDIKENNKKYEEKELIKETNEKYKDKWNKYFKLFQSLSHQHGMVTFLFVLLIMIVGTILIILINKFIAINNMPEGSDGYLMFGTQLIGSTALLFLGIPIGMMLIPLAIKKPFFVITTLDLFNTEYRPKIYYKSYFTFLIMFIITFPFITLSCTNYGYITSTGIYYNGYLDLQEEFISYEEIDKVEIYISYDEENINSLHYVINCDGESLNINTPNMSTKKFSKAVFNIHNKLIELNSCEFVITPPTKLDLKELKERVSSEDYQIILEIFGVK